MCIKNLGLFQDSEIILVNPTHWGKHETVLLKLKSFYSFGYHWVRRERRDLLAIPAALSVGTLKLKFSFHYHRKSSPE